MSKLKIIIYFFVFLYFYQDIYGYETKLQNMKCPICLKDFIDVDQCSSEGYDEKELIINNKIIMCPHCLYSSFSYDFNNLNDSEKVILSKKLPQIKLELGNLETKIISEIDSLNLYLPIYLVKEIEKFRGPSKKRRMDVLLFQYNLTKIRCLILLEPIYKKMVIEELKKQLNEEFYKNKEKLIYTYLLGQFYIRDNDKIKALEQFERALFFLESSSESSAWFEKRIKEQINYIKISDLTIKEIGDYINGNNINSEFQKELAIQFLSYNDDLASWIIISEYVMKDVNRLNTLYSLTSLSKEKLQIYNKFWLWIQDQYNEAEKAIGESTKSSNSVWLDIRSNYCRFMDTCKNKEYYLNNEVNILLQDDHQSILIDYVSKPGDTLSSIANLYKTDISRILDLNPSLNINNIQIAENTLIKIIKTPKVYSECAFIKHIASLLKEKNADAQIYFFKWLATVGPNYFYRLDDSILDCLLVLNQNKECWQMPIEADLSANDQQKMIYQCLLMVKGLKNSKDYLLSYISANHNIGNDIPIGILKAFNDKSAKKILIDFLKTNTRHIDIEIENYLKWAGSEEDIIELDKILILSRSRQTSHALSVEQFIQSGIENIIREIKLRVLMKKSLE